MQKSILLTLCCLLCALTGLNAANKPHISTPENTTWYIIQFCNGENALTAQADGQKVKTGVPTGKASQLWKLEGSTTTGFTLTSKNGMTLYVDKSEQGGMFYSSSTAPAGNKKFRLTTSTSTPYNGEWVLCPSTNLTLYMNQWGGAGTNKELGLWGDRADINQPVRFIEEAEFLATASPLPLIPYPNSLVRGEGSIALKDLTSVTYTDDTAKPVAEMLAGQLSAVSGKAFAIEKPEAAKKGAINFVKDETMGVDEYKMSVTADGIVITAAQYGGYFYGMQTLRQLLPVDIYKDEVAADWADWSVPLVTIEDKPNYEWRGFHFDVSRHFFTMDEVKKLLEAASTFKMNRMHWHLTDDQGWRIEIPEYPLLTTIGAERKGSFTLEGGGTPDGAQRFFDDTPYGKGCFYTKDQLKEMVAYAKSLNIEIIPEIDMPGHMQAVLAAYPEFSCYPERTYEVRLIGGINHDVLNVGEDKVVDFLKCVLGHVAECFPYPYIHLGGDECPKTRWNELAAAPGDNAIKKRMREEGLKSTGELQPWLIQELATYLQKEHGKGVMAWDELLHFWDPDKFTFKPLITAWNMPGTIQVDGQDKRMTQQEIAHHYGLKSVCSHYSNVYLDFPQVPKNEELIDEPYVGGWGVCTLPGVYNYNPRGSMAGKQEYVIGVQGNLWTETTSTIREAEYQYYPRILALSEVGWLQHEKKDWVSFYQRMQKVVKILDAKDIVYAKHYIEKPEYTALQALQVEADQLIADTKADQVGYPSQAVVDALRNARNTATDVETLSAAIAAFKAAPVVMPVAGKLYKINSAATATRYRYNGSSIYIKDNELRVHYTPQSENEELFRFTPTEDGKGFILSHATSGREVTMGKINSKLTLTDKGTSISLRKGAPNRQYDYIPGVVVLTATADTGKVKTDRNIFNDYSGILSTNANDTLCFGATWRITEVENYADFLKTILRKSEEIVAASIPGEPGNPTQEAIDMLINDFITPARKAVNSTVTLEIYMQLAAVYDAFMAIPLVPEENDVIGSLDEMYYYKIQNAWHTDRYAYDNGSGNVKAGADSNEARFLWQICKNADNTVTLCNKATGNNPYGTVESGSAVLTTTERTSWWLARRTTDEGKKGINIMEPSKQFSWYSNAPGECIMRPYEWGAGIWNFVKTAYKVPDTGIDDAAGDKGAEGRVYDLAGRPTNGAAHGVFVTSDGRKVVK